MVKISKDMLINDILAVDAGNAAILMAAGMHCIGCLAAAGESLEEVAAVHGLMQRSLSRRSMIILQKRRLSSILAKVTRCTIKDGEIYEDRRNKSSRAGNIWTDRY